MKPSPHDNPTPDHLWFVKESPLPPMIGRYEVLELLGEGGMGSVFLARDPGKPHHRVAVKLIKPGMDSRAVLRRFEAERRVLSRLHHPNIARILDAGTDQRSHPYFVMEYVPGPSLVDYCDDQRLTIGERLELFSRVCDGVRHAHQKGVIHRDLKPSNILVVHDDGNVSPKVIDFGIAKAMDEDSDSQNRHHTQRDHLLGTPPYISPEQANPQDGEVDTQADVFSLGVILYEMLCGHRPFEFGGAGLPDKSSVYRILCETDPLVPSLRLRSSSSATEIAARRRTTSSSLQRRLRGELNWICRKAIEKGRARRYASVSEFQTDLRRFLGNEPVLAGPPSPVYRLRKAARRHPWWSAGIALAILALAGSSLFFVNLYRRTQEEQGRVMAQRDQVQDDLREERRKNRLLKPLADGNLLASLEAEADTLWPADESLVPALEAWLTKARKLEKDAPGHRTALEELRSTGKRQATPGDHEYRSGLLVEKQTQVRQTLHRVEQFLGGVSLEQASRGVRTFNPTPYENRARLLEEQTRLARRLDERQVWTFVNSEDQSLHEILGKLVERLDRFLDADARKGALASVRERHSHASSVRLKTVEMHQALWQELRQEADHRAGYSFHGKPIAPQVGLVPLGPDPNSGLWEFCDPQSGAVPERDQDGTLEIPPDCGIVFVLIPGGTFSMGAVASPSSFPNHDLLADYDESPVHPVTLDPFLLGKYEVTQGQWLRLTGQAPSVYATSAGGRIGWKLDWEAVTAQHPVEGVNWHEARDALRRIGCDLPSEAQWEYAARSGTHTPWYAGDHKESLEHHENLADQTTVDAGLSYESVETWLEDGRTAHAPVGEYFPNGFGLHDTLGNVCEWCLDDYAGQAYTFPVRQGDGLRLLPPLLMRTLRGGSFEEDSRRARVSRRKGYEPEVRSADLGIRAMRKVRPSQD